MLDFSNIGEALRRLRQDRGWKQAQVADAAQITSPMLSAYETGKQRPSFATIDKILGALGCDARELSIALRQLGGARSNVLAAEQNLPGTPAAVERQLDELIARAPELGPIAQAEKEGMIRLLAALLWAIRHLRS